MSFSAAAASLAAKHSLDGRAPRDAWQLAKTLQPIEKSIEQTKEYIFGKQAADPMLNPEMCTVYKKPKSGGGCILM